MNLSKELWWGFALTLLFAATVVIGMLSGSYKVSIQRTRPVTPTLMPTQVIPSTVPTATPTSQPTATPTQKVTATPTPTAAGLTLAVVAKHNNPNDCWIVIGGSVYNVTNYLDSHPGGAQAIIPYCGADATDAFQSVDNHQSRRAQNDLSSLLIGPLK